VPNLLMLQLRLQQMQQLKFLQMQVLNYQQLKEEFENDDFLNRINLYFTLIFLKFAILYTFSSTFH